MSNDGDAGTWDCESWLRQISTPLDSCDPEVPLSDQEKSCFDDLFASADVIGFGEMTHGSKQVFLLKDRLLRYLVEHSEVTIIVLESSVAATRALNDFVLGVDSDPANSLAATGYWSCANVETLALVKWLRKHNATKTAASKVKFFGCDIQSMDQVKAELDRQLVIFSDRNIISEPDRMQTQHCLNRLPQDSKLNERIGMIFKELDADQPSTDRLAELQADQAKLIGEVSADVDAVIDQLEKTRLSLTGELNPEERFFFDRCVRSLEQSLDHFRFERGGVARDRHMAENILALRDHFQGQKIFTVSGNWHVARVPIVLEGADDYVTMGSLIADRLGDKYCVIGTAFHSGTYLGFAGESAESDVVVDTHIPQPDTWEYWLNTFATNRAGPVYLIDFRSGRPGTHAAPWPNTLKMNIGEAGARHSYEATYILQQPHQQYDATLFITTTTPITVLPQYYE